MLETDTQIPKNSSKYLSNLKAIQIGHDEGTDNSTRRHLLRFWLRDPHNAWQTPEALKPRWSALYDGVTAESKVLPVEPYIRSASNKAR